MRIKITFESSKGKKIIFPIHYNFIIQSFIYKNIDEALAEFLHNKGFEYGKRKFKMFVFSRIFSPEIELLKGEIKFGKTIHFFLSSPLKDFLSQFAENLLKNPEFKIYKNNLSIKEIYILTPRKFEEKVMIKMLSPLTVYSTLLKGERKKTYYYSPFEKEFEEQLKENLSKKYESFHKSKRDFDFKIKPINVRKGHEKIVKYKGTVIKGWLGKYEIESDRRIIEFAYDTGLGAKNPQGFGMFEICT